MKISPPLPVCLYGALLALIPASIVYSHGTPIQIGVAGDELLVSGGTTDDEGFASQVFLQEGEDGDPFGAITLPGLGPVILWQLPGLDISGMDNESDLSIEIISRPVKDSDPEEERLLWYWNPATEIVEAAPDTAAMYLLGTGMRYAVVGPPDGDAPPPFTLANSVAGQQGFHNHGLLSYALDNSPLAPTGAYGLFARFLSDQYTASEPFLVVFNYGADYEQMVMAALGINAAAVSGVTENGDFNHDGIVDAADYTVWRDGLGSTYTPEHYGIWKENFGQSFGAAGSVSVSVPEPAFQAPLALLALLSRLGRGCRTPRRLRVAL